LAGSQGDFRQSLQAWLEALPLSGDPRLAEQAARLALYLHDNIAALDAGERWRELAPDSSAAHEVMALALLRSGRSDEALKHLRAVLQLEAAEGGGGFERLAALLSREAGKHQGPILAVMQGLLAEHPAEPQAHEALAELALQFDDPELALAAAERAGKLAPDWTTPDLLVVQAYLKTGEGDKAVELLEQVLQQQPDDYDLRLQYARVLLGLERTESALQQVELLLVTHPGDAQVRYVAALLALELGENERAREYLLQLVNTGQRTGSASFYLGRLAQVEGDAKGALRWYRQVDGPLKPEAMLQLATLLAQQGQPAAAYAQLQGVRAQYPAYAAQSYVQEAGQWREEGRLEESVALATKALEAHPDNVDLRYARALTLVMLDRIDAAVRDLRRLLAAHPEDPQLLNALGYTLVDRTPHIQEGFELVEQAYALSPDSPAIMDSMGWALYRLQRADEALQLLQQAYAVSQDGEIAAHLAEVLWTLGDRQEARRILAEALKREPAHKIFLDTRKRLQ
jgi:tetratricopeptide (TPR) repeat protein